jgi:hypothetical protein
MTDEVTRRITEIRERLNEGWILDSTAYRLSVPVKQDVNWLLTQLEEGRQMLDRLVAAKSAYLAGEIEQVDFAVKAATIATWYETGTYLGSR